ncbi:DUF2793 domain-containing protein [Microbulbifer thermotolerans]|uniref:DUF2793 domain-containing protein n=1 Tax=Microbulbifer thermotolerans TaxID=252514 RepID=UPI002671063E|nr:DUF2793 domain-containing protein [Microbulbifer thermotolerans]WKT59095.1 DUF2793 domain-containing protein [Microbulbifer thermotolerans]
MANTPNNGIPYLDENVTDPAAATNLALDKIDGLLQLSVLGIEDAPPSEVSDGDRYIVGSGTGDWSGRDGLIARYVADGDYWTFQAAYYCVNQGDQCFYCRFGGDWYPMLCISS